MKTFFCFFCVLSIIHTVVNAQSVGIGTTSPNAAALMHVDLGATTSKSFLVTGVYDNSVTAPDFGNGSRMIFYPAKSALRAGYTLSPAWSGANIGSYSVALGLSTIASGGGSFAMGTGVKAIGTLSCAFGNNTVAEGTNSMATGIRTEALGHVSTTFGFHTIARGFASTVIGVYNDSILTNIPPDETSPTNPLFIIGNGSADNNRSNAMVVLKNGSVGIGTNAPNANALLHVNTSNTSKCFLVSGQWAPFDATVPNLNSGSRMMFFPGRAAFRAGVTFSDEWNDVNVGSSSVAMGSETIASGWHSFAMGDRTEARADGAAAFGSLTIARGYASTVVGLFNDPVLASAQTAVTSTTPLFIVGNGASGALSNAMVVLKNGNVGIGTNAPTANLVLNDAASTTLQLQAAGVEKGFVQLSGDNLRLGTYATNPTGNLIFRLNGGDRFTLLPNGNATLTGTLTQNSDERFKQDITPISDALDKVMHLNGYEYHWKPELQRDSALQIGLIAQNVEKVLPQLVASDKEGTKSVAYQNMVPVLIEAIKELQLQVKDLKTKINK